MAIIIEQLPRVAIPAGNDGGIFQDTLTTTGGGDSTIYVLPFRMSGSPAVSRDGSAKVYAGNPNPVKVLSGATIDANIIWGLWDGTSLFADNVTCVKVVDDGTAGKVSISVKTDRN